MNVDVTGGRCGRLGRCAWPLGLFLALLLPLTPLRGITVLPLSEEEMARRASLIVHGTVEGSEARYDRGEIVTFTTLGVREVLKGEGVPAQITLRHLGGRVGNRISDVPGAPRFSPGEEILAFLLPIPDEDAYEVLGFSYGLYRVVRDPRSGAKVVDGPSFHTRHADPSSGRLLPLRERGKVLLGAFLAEIRAHVAGEQ